MRLRTAWNMLDDECRHQVFVALILIALLLLLAYTLGYADGHNTH